jgi:flagellar L-ring protein precursor FlgH
MALAACAKLQQIGQPPAMTEAGINERAVSGLNDPRLYYGGTSAGPADSDGSLWRSGPASLFGDRRARMVGDILTIVIEIDDEAEINNSSERSRAGSENLNIPSLVGIPQIVDGFLPEGASLANAASVTSGSSSSGDGSIRRNEKLTLRVAATVTEVLPNGNLVVQGNQEVRVNFELRDLQVAGIVRPEDISRQNEITYDKIAGARISYGGRGLITDVQQPRYGQQAADILLPF